MRDGIYRLDLAAQEGVEHGAIRLTGGAFLGAGVGYVYQGRLGQTDTASPDRTHVSRFR